MLSLRKENYGLRNNKLNEKRNIHNEPVLGKLLL